MNLLKLEVHPGRSTVYINAQNIVAIFDFEGHANIKTTAGGDRATIAVVQSAAEVFAMMSDDGSVKRK